MSGDGCADFFKHRRSEHELTYGVSQNDQFDGVIGDVANGRQQLLAMPIGNAGIDDNDTRGTDNETGVGDPAAIFGCDRVGAADQRIHVRGDSDGLRLLRQYRLRSQARDGDQKQR